MEKINAWDCPECGKPTVTVERVEGVTPFMLGCRATPGCKGMGRSRFYRNVDGLTPTHEWIRKSVKWAKRKGPWMLDHVEQGGLVIEEKPFVHAEQGKGEPIDHGS